MTLSAGTRLGPYEILAPLGAGGMGEVYRARDDRLKRDVAIKVLPATFSSDPDRLRRFEHEAQAAGSLNHPNITAVYDIGTHDGAPYVVQELLEGETLRSELAGGRFSPRKAIDYGIQIAHGLAAAHEKSIVHRDLKPENLFLTKDGRVKILDFGLAKLAQVEGSASVSKLPTSTEPGLVMGTLGYISPEQIKNEPADARSDIFALGVILYEMLSGQRPFRGNSAGETMAAILKEDPPDLSVTNKNISPGLERLVHHCIEKNPERRFQSARDLAYDLETLSTVSGAAGPAKTLVAPSRRWRKPLVAAALLGVGLLAGWALHASRRTFSTPPSYKRLTFRRGNLGTARFGPDGRSVVYSASWEGQPIEIYTTRPEGPESAPVGVKNADLLSVSPSGDLAITLKERFLDQPFGLGTLATVPLGGGAPRPIVEFVSRADWAPDGKQLAVVRFLEGRYRLEFPLGKVLYSSERYLGRTRFSPKGDRFALLEYEPAGRGSSVLTVDLAGNSKRLAGLGIRGQGLAWSPSGNEIWFDDRIEGGHFVLRAVDLSGHLRTLASAPTALILHDITRDGRVLLERFTGQSGTLGLAPGETRERDLSWFDLSVPVSLSDDGRLVLLNERGDAAGPAGAYYVRKTDGSPAVKLGEGTAVDLSADGKWVLAHSPDASARLLLQPTGTGTSIPIGRGGFEKIFDGKIFPDGRRLLITANEPGKKRRFYVYEISSGKPRAISPEGFQSTGRPISADGRWVVAIRDWAEDLFVFSTEGGPSRTIPDTKALDPICWTADGKFLLALERGSLPARVVRIEVATGRREPWKELAPAEATGLFGVNQIRITPDGRWYVYGYARAATSDVYLVEGVK
jgi:serine/threonine protein kinase